MSNILDIISAENIKKDAPKFEIGDTVKVSAKIREGGKERIQIFPGTVIARSGEGANETFTVRRTSFGVGVEKVFPVHSPHIVNIEVERSAHVRRAKLYFLRQRSGRKARLRDRK
ncbi:MAG: 50S ribosomal protein L19 [Lentisphaerae bacterium]|jgi:large subunit ribosomal protein L19|nr:50S ribosomal protein L19 [Lentisphaerota bacterium]